MEWQPIETAPKDGTIIMLWGHGDTMQPCFYAPEPFHLWATSWAGLSGEFMHPTHWMPLPEPPSKQ